LWWWFRLRPGCGVGCRRQDRVVAQRQRVTLLRLGGSWPGRR